MQLRGGPRARHDEQHDARGGDNLAGADCAVPEARVQQRAGVRLVHYYQQLYVFEDGIIAVKSL